MLTTIVMSSEIISINEEIMVLIQFPKFTIYDIEVFIAEIIRDLIDVVLLLEELDDLEEIRLSQFRERDPARPRFVHVEKYPGYHCVYVSRVELNRFL